MSHHHSSHVQIREVFQLDDAVNLDVTFEVRVPEIAVGDGCKFFGLNKGGAWHDLYCLV